MTETLKRGFPGMKSVKDMPILQDVPPPGGFPAIRIERRLPSTGPTGVTIFATGIAVMAYGYYKVYGMIQERKQDKYYLDSLRAAIIPVLQAEADMKYLEIERQKREQELKLMGKSPEWQPDWTNSETGRWIPPLEETGIWNPFVR